MRHIVDKDAADSAARGLWNVEHLDMSLGRPNWRQLDREPPRDSPTIENHKVQGERRERVRSGIGDHKIGAATATLLLKLVDLLLKLVELFTDRKGPPSASVSQPHQGILLSAET